MVVAYHNCQGLSSSYFKDIFHSYPRATFAACNLSQVVSPSLSVDTELINFLEEAQDGEERDEYQKSVKSIPSIKSCRGGAQEEAQIAVKKYL